MNSSNSSRTLPQIFSSVSSVIGIHVFLIVLERSLWKTKNRYPEASKIHFSEEGINLEELETVESEKTELIVDEFVCSIVETLSRLIGSQVAEKLTVELNN